MAKILTDKEMLNIVQSAILDPRLIDCAESYQHFIEDLGELICTHFGGERGVAGYDNGDGLGWTIGFYVNENVPADGGVFRNYDPDVIWKDGEETQL